MQPSITSTDLRQVDRELAELRHSLLEHQFRYKQASSAEDHSELLHTIRQMQARIVALEAQQQLFWKLGAVDRAYSVSECKYRHARHVVCKATLRRDIKRHQSSAVRTRQLIATHPDNFYKMKVWKNKVALRERYIAELKNEVEEAPQYEPVHVWPPPCGTKKKTCIVLGFVVVYVFLPLLCHLAATR